MLARRIIPCLDIKDDRVVKGRNFQNLIDSGDPLEMIKRYVKQGADELVLLDIAATVEERAHRVDLVKIVARSVPIPFCVGGGVSSAEQIKELLDAGADKVSIGSAAVTNPEFVKEAVDKFGGQAIVVSIDPKRKGPTWEVFIKSGSENSGIDAVLFAKTMEKTGVGELLVNSLDKDGMEEGFDIDLLKSISEGVDIPVIASSGAGSPDHFVEVFANTGVTAVLSASIFHSGKYTVDDVKRKLMEEKIEVRI